MSYNISYPNLHLRAMWLWCEIMKGEKGNSYIIEPCCQMWSVNQLH